MPTSTEELLVNTLRPLIKQLSFAAFFVGLMIFSTSTQAAPRLKLAKFVCNEIESGSHFLTTHAGSENNLKEIVVALPSSMKGAISVESLVPGQPGQLKTSHRREELVGFLEGCIALYTALGERDLASIDIKKVVEGYKNSTSRTVLSWHWVDEESMFERLNIRSRLNDSVGRFTVPAF